MQQCTLGLHSVWREDILIENREELEEQHAISKEIASALTQGSAANAVDDDELESELADLQQEELDSKMLGSGPLPVSDQIHRLPSVATGEGKSFMRQSCCIISTNTCFSQGKGTSPCARGRRRGGRVAETPGRNGHVVCRVLLTCPTTSSFLFELHVLAVTLQLLHISAPGCTDHTRRHTLVFSFASGVGARGDSRGSRLLRLTFK